MAITGVIPQLRTTDMPGTLNFYTSKLGCTLEFLYEDFYAGLRAGGQVFHLKRIDERDPSIDHVEHYGHFHLYFQSSDIDADAAMIRRNGVKLERDVHQTDWGTREFVIHDDQGHTLYFGQPSGTDAS